MVVGGLKKNRNFQLTALNTKKFCVRFCNVLQNHFTFCTFRYLAAVML